MKNKSSHLNNIFSAIYIYIYVYIRIICCDAPSWLLYTGMYTVRMLTERGAGRGTKTITSLQVLFIIVQTSLSPSIQYLYFRSELIRHSYRKHMYS